MNTDLTLPRTMRAVVTHGVGDYRLEERPVPQPGPGEVLVKVHDCGICASDMKCFGGAALFWGDAKRPRYVQPPVIAGHEFTGEVAALGEGAGEHHGVRVGDRVVAEQIMPCGECRYCRTGLYWLCREAWVFGFKQIVQGGMADYMIFPARARVYRIPDAITPRAAAMIEPLACSIHAVERAEIKLGDVAVVAGCGPLGLGMVAAARLKNPGLLIAIDPIDMRLDVAKKMGADLTINPTKEDAVDRVRELTEGYGCDAFIEATGHADAVVPGLHMIRKMGTYVEFSVMLEPTLADWTIIGDGKELNIHGAHLAPYTFPVAIDLIARGLIDVEPVVTHEFALADFEQGFAAVRHPSDTIKVLLKP